MANERTRRSSNQELPDVDEVFDLIERFESPRLGAENTWVIDNPGQFAAVRGLAEILGAPDMFTACTGTITKDKMSKAVAHIESAKQAVKDSLLSGAELSTETAQRVFDSLAIVGDVKDVDAIFVFGAPSNTRIDYASELFSQSVAPKIVISGRGPNWQSGVDTTEAQRMADRAVDLGVPEEALVLEHQALTIPDNVKRTVDLFEEIGFDPQSLAIVASEWVLLRAFIDWKRFPSEDIDITCLAPPTLDPKMNRSEWHTYEKGIDLVLNEYAKIIHEFNATSYLKAKATR